MPATLLKRRMVIFFLLKRNFKLHINQPSSICPSYPIMKTVFSEGKIMVSWEELWLTMKRKNKKRLKQRKTEALIVLHQKPLFLWKKLSKRVSCQVTLVKIGTIKTAQTTLHARVCDLLNMSSYFPNVWGLAQSRLMVGKFS